MKNAGLIFGALLLAGGIYWFFIRKGEAVADAAKPDDGSGSGGGGGGGSSPDAPKGTPTLGLGSSLTDTIVPVVTVASGYKPSLKPAQQIGFHLREKKSPIFKIKK